MGFDQPWHWLVVIAIAAVLFGYKRLPDASRSLGRSLRIFKTEIKGLNEDDKARQEAATPAAVPTAPAPAAPPAENVVATPPVAPAAAPAASQAPAEPPAPPAAPAE